jgi:mono/diheme cytochrome c family protein
MPMRRLLLAAAAFVAVVSTAWAADDAERGLLYATANCSECHAVTPEQAESPNIDAPPFAAVARTEGMSAPSLFTLLRTSHQTMPNLVIQANDLNDVVAYILSLKP